MARIKGISKYEIEFLFTNARFNLKQIEQLTDLCRILGKYMFVDRNILDARSNEKIGLSFLKKGSKYHIIAEMQEETPIERKEKYYYQLGMGGKYMLEKNKDKYNPIGFLAGRAEKSRILTFNYFAIEEGYDIDMRYKQELKHRFFFCKNGVVCYYQEQIAENKLVQELRKILTKKDEEPPTTEEIRNKFNFIPIEKKLIDIGSKTKTTLIK